MGDVVGMSGAIGRRVDTSDEARLAIQLSAPQGRTRYDSIECLRLASAFGVVWFHAHVGSDFAQELAYSGLVSFVLITAFFTTLLNGGWGNLKSALLRISVLWIVWFFVFACARAAFQRLDLPDNIVSALLVGPSIHLWYLPFLLIALPALVALRAAMSPGQLLYVASGALAAVTVTSFAWRDVSLAISAPAPQYAHALFPLISGVVLASAVRCQRREFALMPVMCSIALIGLPGMGLPYLVGTVLFVAAFAAREHVRAPDFVRAAADCTLGVYLLHPLTFPLARLIAGERDTLVPALAFTSSLAIVMIARSVGGRWLSAVFGFRAGSRLKTGDKPT